MDFSGITVADSVMLLGVCNRPGMPEECLDPLYAADHPETCANSSPIQLLRIDPDDAEVEVGGTTALRAKLVFANGVEKDVTDLATWTSMNVSVLTVANDGYVTGVAVGLSTVKAAFRGKFDLAQITVVAPCTTVGIDFCMVFDRSGSMGPYGPSGTTPDGLTRMQKTIVAAQAFLRNVHWDQDQVSIVSFGGFLEEVDVVNTIFYRDVTVHTSLTNNSADVLTALAGVEPDFDACETTKADGLKKIGCATGIGGGMQAAYDELKSSRHIPGNKRCVVLLTDGAENICDPDPQEVAAQMHTEGFGVIVIALSIDADIPAHECGAPISPRRTVREFLQAMTTCDLFFVADTAAELPNIYAKLPRQVCQGVESGLCMYSYSYL